MIRNWVRRWLLIDYHEDLTDKNSNRINRLQCAVDLAEKELISLRAATQSLRDRMDNLEKELIRLNGAAAGSQEDRDRLDISAAEARGLSLEEYRTRKAERNAERMRAMLEVKESS